MDLSEEMKEFYSEKILKQLQRPQYRIAFEPKYKKFPNLCRWLNWGNWKVEGYQRTIPDKIKIKRLNFGPRLEPLKEGGPYDFGGNVEVEELELDLVEAARKLSEEAAETLRRIKNGEEIE